MAGQRAQGIELREYLQATPIIDHEHPAIRELASQLTGDGEPSSTAERCFNWVRDRIRHSSDHGDHQVTLAASEVLLHGTGLCYAKSHLLAALLRANGIPCGFVYQRLAFDDSGETFCLHGLNAVWLDEHGWYRVDPRGDRSDVATAFDPPHEHLAFTTDRPGESLIGNVYVNPLPVVVNALSRYADSAALCLDLPDWPGDRLTPWAIHIRRFAAFAIRLCRSPSRDYRVG